MTHRGYWHSAGKNTIGYQDAWSPNSPEFRNLSSLPDPILQWIDRNMDGFVTVLDQYGIIRYISKTVEPVLGFSAEDLIGSKWNEWVSEANASSLLEHLDRTLHTQQTFDLDLQTADGKHVWTTHLVTSAKDNDERLFYIATTNDRTDKKEAEDLMAYSEKMSIAGQLASGIVHEIRNPLTSLKGFLQLLQAGVKNEEEFYPIMIEEIEKMESITSELLFISKPMTDQKERENLSEMIEDVVTLFKSQADFKGIEIKQNLKERQIVNCDRSQIKQVFINLLKNAIEAMDNPGCIKVNDQSSQDDIIIDITDEGYGIAEDVIHKLGEPFFTTKQNGTGLGLMITRQILKNHDGRMDAFQNNHCGSTFRVTLPNPDNK